MSPRDYRKTKATITAFITGAVMCAALLAAAILFAAGEPDVTHARTIRTVDATIVLLAGAGGLYFLRYRGPVWWSWWLSLWTFSLVAFIVHLGFAIFGTFEGNFAAIFRNPALVSHPRLDLLLAAWWIADVLLAWFGSQTSWAIRVQRAFLHVILITAFFLATREEGVSSAGRWLGILLVAVTLACAMFWAAVRPPVPRPATA